MKREMDAAVKVIISIHAPLAGSDGAEVTPSWRKSSNFNPRSPCGERHAGIPPSATRQRNFNPRSPCGERPHLSALASGILSISIHAPLAGSDAVSVLERPSWLIFQSTLPLRGATMSAWLYNVVRDISIHAPLAGSDQSPSTIKWIPSIFQSTLPLRGATPMPRPRWIMPTVFQSTLPLRGATADVHKYAPASL